MTEGVFLGVGILAGGLVGWAVGGRSARRRFQEHLSGLLSGVREGTLRPPKTGSNNEPPMVRDLRHGLSDHWVPKGSERDETIREALKRLADFLRHRVEAPLLVGLEAGGDALSEAADSALDAVEDLEFFLEDPPVVPVLESCNLVDLVGEVTREFSGQFTIFVKMEGPQEPLRVQVDPEPLKDAIFLILHNAGEFGGREAVHMTLRKEEDRVRILVRDKGPGFSADALIRALDPFYSTSVGGLGLGLPYARMAVKAQGGEVVLRNPEEGGAEVEIILPQGG